MYILRRSPAKMAAASPPMSGRSSTRYGRSATGWRGTSEVCREREIGELFFAGDGVFSGERAKLGVY